MSRQRTIIRHYGPVVIQPDYIISSRIDHRFHSQRHTGLQKNAFSSSGEVGHLRILMQMSSDSMTYQVSYYPIAETFGIFLDSCGNII